MPGLQGLTLRMRSFNTCGLVSADPARRAKKLAFFGKVLDGADLLAAQETHATQAELTRALKQQARLFYVFCNPGRGGTATAALFRFAVPELQGRLVDRFGKSVKAY